MDAFPSGGHGIGASSFSAPRCPVCQAKLRRSGGSSLCSKCGYQDERKEEVDDRLIDTRGLRRKVKRVLRLRQRRWINTTAGSAAAHFALAKAIQYCLQEALLVLVDDIGLPPEVQDVAEEIWLVFLNLYRFDYRYRWEQFGREHDDVLGKQPLGDGDLPLGGLSECEENPDERPSDGEEALDNLDFTLPSYPTVEMEIDAQLDSEVNRLAQLPVKKKRRKKKPKVTAHIFSSSESELDDTNDNRPIPPDLSDDNWPLLPEDPFITARHQAGIPSTPPPPELSIVKEEKAEEMVAVIPPTSWSTDDENIEPMRDPLDSAYRRLRPPSRRLRGSLESAEFPRLAGRVPVTWKTDPKVTHLRVNYQTGHKNITGLNIIPTVPAILYLACQWLRLPVLLQDLYRWVETDRIPLRRAISILPLKIVPQIHQVYLKRQHIMGAIEFKHYEAQVFEISHLMRLNYRIEVPPLNRALILHRLIDNLSLPVQFYHEAEGLCDLLPVDLSLEHPTSGIPEVTLAAVLIVLIMMHYGLDGMPRTDPDHPLYSRNLPSFAQFITQFGWQLPYANPICPDRLADAREFCERHLDRFVDLAFTYLSHDVCIEMSLNKTATMTLLNRVAERVEKQQLLFTHWIPPLPTVEIHQQRGGTESLAGAENGDGRPSSEPHESTSEADKAYSEYQRWYAAINTPDTASARGDAPPASTTSADIDPVLIEPLVSGKIAVRTMLPYDNFPDDPDIMPRFMAVVLTRFSQVVGSSVAALSDQIQKIMQRIEPEPGTMPNITH
ncbi:hypothetical protein H4R33_002349 [Dimargaris cristalligena]|nr:hypothetical protein H4R33_002349 [Dimargaris cristalligena]